MDSKKLYSKVCQHLIQNSRSHTTALVILYSAEGMTPAFIKSRMEKQNIYLSKFTIQNHRKRNRDFIKSLLAQQK